MELNKANGPLGLYSPHEEQLMHGKDLQEKMSVCDNRQHYLSVARKGRVNEDFGIAHPPFPLITMAGLFKTFQEG